MARLLFVDDDPDIRTMMRRAAERDGFDIQLAADGEAGLAAALENPPDLIVLDVGMPKRDGRDVCRALKAHPATRDVPVLFLSAHGDPFNRHLCLELGAEDLVEKPFDLRALMRRIRHLLRKHAAGTPAA